MTNFNEIWNLLEKYSFKIDSHLLQHLKCIICGKLLIDAHESLCGCNYCQNCIESYLENGPKQCPGDSVDCKLTLLELQVNIIRSNSTNRKIVKLIVSCPFNGCNFTGELWELKDHIRICDKRSIYCPYKEIGCSQSQIPIDNISNHLTVEQFQHSQLLINFILNLKNEEVLSNSLKISQPSDMFFINKSNTSQNCKINVENIPNILQNLQEENIKLKNEIVKNKNNQEEELNKLKQWINSKFERKHNQELSNEINRKVENNNFNNGDKIQEITNNKNLKKISLDDLSTFDTSNPIQIGNNTYLKDSPMENPLNPLEVFSNQIPKFAWTISDLSKIIKKNHVVDSEHFFSKNGDLKIWLDLYTTNRKNMRIRIYISTTPVNSSLKWPLKCQVELTIKSIKIPNAFQKFSKNCYFEKPRLNSSYETFELRNLDLDNANVLQGNKILIECSLSIEN